MSKIPKSNKEVTAEFVRLGGHYCKYEDEKGGCWEFGAGKFIIHIAPWRRPVQPFRKPPTERSSLGIACAIGHAELGALAARHSCPERPRVRSAFLL